MNIIVSDLTYHYPNQQPLFEHLNFSAGQQEKVSIAGSNGAGKSTLLQLMAGMLKPSGGSVAADSEPYYIPQHTGASGKSVAELMRVSEKLAALDAIVKGSVRQPDYDTLADDWEIESRCRAALSYWQVPHITPGMAADNLSGGERTKVLLAGLLIHTPGIILMDEPTNHIDREGRELLYRYIHQSRATMVIVSHDIILLDRLPATCELSAHGIRQYGGNYSFYKEQKEIEAGALSDSIHEEEKALRLAKRQAQEMRQRQERRANHAEKKKEQGGMARIVLNALGGAAENTAARLNGRHAGIISSSRDKLAALRLQEDRLNGLKIDFDHAQLHPGKLLIEARGVNFAWPQGDMLWDTPLDMKLFGNDRIHVTGGNGTGRRCFKKCAAINI